MQLSLLGNETKFTKISQLGDPLEKISRLFDFEILRPKLERFFKNRYAKSENNHKGAGRKAADSVFAFKVLFLKKLYNLSLEATEFEINNRLNFQRFLGLNETSIAPDFTTVWGWENALADEDFVESLYLEVLREIEKSGFRAEKGFIVDATVTEAPKQRNTRGENAQIKKGEIPDSFKDNPKKIAQKDTDARWLIKNGKSFFGYKNHVLVDAKHKLIRKFSVSVASRHDSQFLRELISEIKKDRNLYGDSAYKSNEIDELLESLGIGNNIHEKGAGGKSLSADQIKRNGKKSKTRARVEHVFGFFVNSMKGKGIGTIGLKRAKMQIGMTNICYNIARLVFLKSTAIDNA